MHLVRPLPKSAKENQHIDLILLPVTQKKFISETHPSRLGFTFLVPVFLTKLWQKNEYLSCPKYPKGCFGC